ncbi:hypothetical protein CR513_35892, partial [Mucuna pruriens]
MIRFIGGVLLVDKTNNKVSLRCWQFLQDLKSDRIYAWGVVVLGFRYWQLYFATKYSCISIGGGFYVGMKT